MSIKTVGQTTQSNTRGLEKKISKGAEHLIFDVLQATQYSTPIPSTVRELVTNACDSQREKEIAVEILAGKAQVEDYFITRSGEEYEASNFNREYYDLNYLDMENNHVKVRYIEDDSGSGYCDTVEIMDFGVGIGGRRLEGMLELGYSTKRNTAENFGAFGLGSKVALSTGVPYYSIESAYNGKLFKMNCYPYKTDFVIGKWDSDGQITLSNGEPAYYKNYSGKNYTKISLGAKKHTRRAFSNAVEEQLCYIPSVRFDIVDSQGKSYSPTISRDILLNTDNLIVTDSGWYARPHIVIVKNPGDTTGINYGRIDFRELEMEELWGNIGIKCPMRQSYINDAGEEIVIQDGVDVTPSREKVIWNDNTKKYVQGMLEKAAEDATEIVEEALKEDDFIKWIQLCSNILYKGNTDSASSTDELSAIKHVARMVDVSSIRPKFENTGIKFSNPKSMFKGYRVRVVHATGYRDGIARTDVTDWTGIDLSRVYVAEEGSVSKVKDLYLTSQGVDKFVLISAVSSDKFVKELAEALDDDHKARILKEKAAYELQRSKINNCLSNHTSLLRSYSDIDVPEAFAAGIKFKEEETAGHHLTPAEQRVLEKRIVGFSLRSSNQKWTWDKFEPKIQTILESENETYYCSKVDDYKMLMAAKILDRRVPKWGKALFSIPEPWSASPILFREVVPSNAWRQDLFVLDKIKDLKAPQLFRLSETNLKYAEKNPHWKHIDEFFFTSTEDGGLVASEYLRRVLTHNVITETAWMHKFSWMGARASETLLPDLSRAYKRIYRHSQHCIHTSALTDNDSSKEAIEFRQYLENFIEYQRICNSGDVSLRKQKSRELFVVDVPTIDAYDEDLAGLITVLEEAYADIGEFMKAIHEGLTACSYSGNLTEIMDPLTTLFSAYNKFDIEVPDVEVPRLWFSLTPPQTN
jgi:hypothetical protein